MKRFLIFFTFSISVFGQQPAWEEKIDQFMDSNRMEEAIDVLHGLLSEDSKNAEAWFYLAICLYATDDTNSALHALERMAVIKPDDEKAAKLKTRILLTQKIRREARTHKGSKKLPEPKIQLPKEVVLSHVAEVEKVHSIRDIAYSETLAAYESYLTTHPEAFEIWIEKCEFIGTVYYDEEEDINPNFEAYSSCLQEILNQFPDQPEVLLYYTDNSWNENDIDLLNKVLTKDRKQPFLLELSQVAKAHQILARKHRSKDQNEQALFCAQQAMMMDDQLDLSLFLADIYSDLNMLKSARRVLIEHLEHTSEPWEHNRKGIYLYNLGAFEHAVNAFEKAESLEFPGLSRMDYAKALIKTGKTEEAKNLYLSITSDWLAAETHLALFKLFLEEGNAGEAEKQYRSLRDVGWQEDSLSKHRLALFFHFPTLRWTGADFLGLLSLFGALLCLFLLPSFLTLPVHYLGFVLKERGWKPKMVMDRWQIHHAYALGFYYLIVCFSVLYVYEYSILMELFSDFINSPEYIAKAQVASSSILSMGTMGFGALLFLRRRDFYLFKKGDYSWKRILITGTAGAIGLLIFFKIFNLIFLATSLNETVIQILAIRDTYGVWIAFAFVCLLVPIYEEFFFRSILLGSFSKHIPFFLSNLLQAALFATIHFNFKHFIFYFAFGMITGHLKQKSNSLLPGITFHIINNFIVFLTLLRIPYPY